VNSLGSNAIGVILNGRTLHIENCILNSNEIGVWSTGPGMLDVKDSVFRGNLFGIKVEPTSGTSAATIEKTRFEANSDGLDAADGAIVTVHNSLASGNLNLGFGAASFTSRAVEMNLEGCVSSNNQAGVSVASISTGPATVRLSNSTVTNNKIIGLSVGGSPAALLSRGNNTVEGNGTDISGTIGSYSPK